MRTISIYARPDMEQVTTEWLAHLVLAIPTGPGASGLIFDGNQADGTVVAQRRPGVWTVSFRRPDGTSIGYYTNPHVVARVIIDREHDESAQIPRPANVRGGEDVTAELLACTGMEPQP